jgi:Ca2+-binding EF-hand superfamily protein
MRPTKALLGTVVALSLLASPAYADQKEKKVNMDEFMKSCDMNHDGMVSKEEMLKHMEKMFDKMDTKKTGKLDKKQAEEFLKQFTKPSGA